MGFLSLLAWHSGPPAGGPHDGLLAQWRIDGAIQVRSNVDPTFYSLVGSGRSGGDHHGSSLLENPYIPYQCMDSYLSSAGLGIVPFEPFFHAFPRGLEKAAINRIFLILPSRKEEREILFPFRLEMGAEKKTSDQVYTCWSLVNEEKKENLKNEFLNRIEALDKKGSIENILEKTTRFCHNETQKEYLPKIYDPFLHGISRGRIKKLSPFQIITKTYKKKNIRGSWINKIHAILLKINSQKFEQTIEKFKTKSLSIEKKLYFFSEPQEEKIQSEEEIKIFKILFDVVIIYNNDQTLIKNFIDFHEINKQVPQWSYKLTSELEELEAETEENIPTEPGIRSRKAKRVVVFTDLKEPHNEIYTNLKDNQNSDQTDEMALIRYSQQSDFRREIIKGSMRSQRR
ncbi:unnamed protein product, partial [Brassica oleracea]